MGLSVLQRPMHEDLLSRMLLLEKWSCDLVGGLPVIRSALFGGTVGL